MSSDIKYECGEVYQKFSVWCASALGDSLLTAEQSVVRELLGALRGHRIAQLGFPAGRDFMSGSGITEHLPLLLFPPPSSMFTEGMALQCSSHCLPLADESMDVVLLPHCLEFSDNPHQVLREVERVLIADGHVVLVGFNPLSLWGLARLVRGRRGGVMPWRGHYVNVGRLRDWLSLLNFDVIMTRYVYYRLPLPGRRMQDFTAPLEAIGASCWRPCAAACVMMAKKRVIPLTPIRMRWSLRHCDATAGAARHPVGARRTRPPVSQSR